MKVVDKTLLEEIKEELEVLQDKSLDGSVKDVYTEISNVILSIDYLLDD